MSRKHKKKREELLLAYQLERCRSKRAYANEVSARKAIRSVKSAFGHTMYWYQCPFCTGIHLTSSPPREIRKGGQND
jgi:hypothetical protein